MAKGGYGLVGMSSGFIESLAWKERDGRDRRVVYFRK